MVFLDSFSSTQPLTGKVFPGPLGGTFSLYTLSSIFICSPERQPIQTKNSQIVGSQPDCRLWARSLQSATLQASQQESSIPLPPGGQQHSTPLRSRFPPRTSHLLTRHLGHFSSCLLLPQTPSLTCPPSKISSSCSPTQVVPHAKDLQSFLILLLLFNNKNKKKLENTCTPKYVFIN